jgi:hypothetical protein
MWNVCRNNMYQYVCNNNVIIIIIIVIVIICVNNAICESISND